MKKPIRILLVDDEELVRNTLAEFLSHWNYESAFAGSLQECYALLGREEFSLVLCDVRLGSDSGLDLISYLREQGNKTPIIMMSGYATIKLAVEATRLGAAYLLEKPINTKELKRSIQKVLSETPTPIEPVTDSSADEQEGGDYYYSQDPKVQDIIRMAKIIAPTDAPVLITGASGTGKEVLARIIHQHGDRKDGAFVAVNCGAIPENLVESELFGHVKGAFTGAVRNRKGLFEEANGGTLFLDEIGELPLHVQVKFLRVLQEKRFEPVGSNKSVRSSFRLVSATNKDLEQEVETGGFRSDLLFRINVIHLHNPTLLERPVDVIPLARFFLERFNLRHQYKITGMTEEVEELLKLYHWPGNIRELENTMERLAILTQNGDIEKRMLPPSILKVHAKPRSVLEEIQESMLAQARAELDGGVGKIDLAENVRGFEAEIIARVLQQTEANKKEAAKFLSMNRTTLVEKVNRYPELESFRRPPKRKPRRSTKKDAKA